MEVSDSNEDCKMCLMKHDAIDLTSGNIDEFLSSMSAETGHTLPCPFTKFHLHDISFESTTAIGPLFSNHHGLYIHVLQLSITNSSIAFNSKDFKSLMMTLPNLSKLKIYDNRTGSSIFWFDFNPAGDALPPSCCPKLQSLKLTCWCLSGPKPQAFLTQLFAATINLVSLGLYVIDPIPDDDWAPFIALQAASGLNIKGLMVLKLSHINHSDLTILLKLCDQANIHGLSLSKLHINALFGESFINQHQIQKLESLLAQQSSSLVSLSLKVDVKYKTLHNSKQNLLVLKLPVMTKLKKLKIHTILYGLIFIHFDSFVGNFPALQHLEFVNIKAKSDVVGWNRGDEAKEFANWEHHFNNFHPNFRESLNFVPTSFVHHALNILSISYGLRTSKQIQILATLFPNLKDLTIVIECIKLLRDTWKGWPKLTRLSISTSKRKRILLEKTGEDNNNSFCLDELITGIPATQHCNLKSTLGSSTEILQVLAKVKTYPGLSDLKQLIGLDLNLNPWARGMTDLSVHLGFAIPTTKLVNVHIACGTSVSLEARENVKKILGSDAVISFTETLFLE